MAASVVDLPEPVGPVTKISPCAVSDKLFSVAGMFKSSIVGIFVGIVRNANEIEPRCWNALTRKRETPAIS